MIVCLRRPEGPEVNILFDRIDRLLSVQDERLAKDLEELALGSSSYPRAIQQQQEKFANITASPQSSFMGTCSW